MNINDFKKLYGVTEDQVTKSTFNSGKGRLMVRVFNSKEEIAQTPALTNYQYLKNITSDYYIGDRTLRNDSKAHGNKKIDLPLDIDQDTITDSFMDTVRLTALKDGISIDDLSYIFSINKDQIARSTNSKKNSVRFTNSFPQKASIPSLLINYFGIVGLITELNGISSYNRDTNKSQNRKYDIPLINYDMEQTERDRLKSIYDDIQQLNSQERDRLNKYRQTRNDLGDNVRYNYKLDQLHGTLPEHQPSQVIEDV